jgi:hypothetical protein
MNEKSGKMKTKMKMKTTKMEGPAKDRRRPRDDRWR